MDWDTMEMDLRLLAGIVVVALPILVISLLSPATAKQLPGFLQFQDVTIWEHLIGLVCVSIPFYIVGEISGAVIRKRSGSSDIRRGIELGDTLIMAAGGLLIGWKSALMAAFIGILLAAVFGLINKHRSGESKFAFGPYLAIGLFIGALFGDALMDWYIGFLTYDPTAM